MHLGLKESKLLNKKSMGCGSRICFSKTFIFSNQRDIGSMRLQTKALRTEWTGGTLEKRRRGTHYCSPQNKDEWPNGAAVRNLRVIYITFSMFSALWERETGLCFMVQYKSREVAQSCAINQVNSQHPFSPASNQVKFQQFQ